MLIQDYKTYTTLNESIKVSSPGKIAKIFDYYAVEELIKNKWEDVLDLQKLNGINLDEGYFIIKIKKEGRKYIEGELLYTNGLFRYGFRPGSYLRCLKEEVYEASQTYQSLKSYIFKEDKTVPFNIFINGDENFLLDNNKGIAITMNPGDYIYTSTVNFKLSKKFNEPILVYKKYRGHDTFSIKLKNVNKLRVQLNNDEYSVLGEWISKKIGIELEHRDSFRYAMTYYEVYLPNIFHDLDISYGIYLTEEIAQKVIEKNLKENLLVLKDKNFKINKKQGRIDFEELINLLKVNNIKFNVNNVLHELRGVIIGKKYGI